MVGWLAGWLVELVGVGWLGKLVRLCKLVLAMLLFVASKLWYHTQTTACERKRV